MISRSRQRKSYLLALIIGAGAFASSALSPLDHSSGVASNDSQTTAANQLTTTPTGQIAVISTDEAIANTEKKSSSARQTPAPADANTEKDDSGFRYYNTGIPAGFEAWFEARKVALDVFYGGRYLLTTLAEHTGSKITLLHPEEVAEQIPGVLNSTNMAELLRSPMLTNSDKVCEEPNQALCGRLEPDTVALIFDETRIRADLFIHRELLAEVAEADPRYLPDGDKQRPTLVQNLNALYTGDDAGEERYSLFGRTRAGNNGNYAFSDWVSTSDQDISVDQLGYRHDLRDHLITVGLFETNLDMLRGMNRDLLLGAGVEKSMMRRTDLQSIISTPIDLFLPTRGRVDIFRDGRLVASGFYEAGNQRIDTSRLPAGAYLIEIVTTDAAGNISADEQLFVKSTLLAPPGESIWFAEAGKVGQRDSLETFPEELDVTLMRAGYRWRHASWLGLGVAGAASEDAALGELSANMIFDWIEAGGEVYSSTAGGSGVGARAIMRHNQHTLSLNARHSNADPIPAANAAQYRLIEDDRWLYSGQITSQIKKQGVLSASTSISGGDGTSTSRRSNLRYTHYLFLPGNTGLTLTGDVGEIDGEPRINFAVQWRATRDHWSHTAEIDWSASDIPGDRDGTSAEVATRWSDRETYADEIDAGLSAQIDEQGHGVTADLNHASEYGRGRAAISYNQRDNFRSTQYLAGYDTSIVFDESWIPAGGGGPQSAQAAAILDLRDGKGSTVDVYADGQRQFSAGGGRRVPLTLMPYREYQISLIDRGTALVNFDAEPRRLVLYPGDVKTLDWQLQRVNVIVGRLQRIREFCSEVTGECHTLRLPVADIRIEGLEGFTFTDADGFFQGEIRNGQSTLRVNFAGQECQLDISQLQVENGVIRAPNLICDMTSR